MFFKEVHADLDSIRNSARPILRTYFGGSKPKIFSSANAAGFFSGLGDAIKLMAAEPEILMFAALQWGVIALGYICWTQMLNWIPDDVWNAIDQASREDQKTYFRLINLALLAWSFVIVLATSYPIAIFSSAIVAARNLRTLGQPPNVLRCLWIAERHIGRLWAYTTVDDWITVNAILDRLPKKHGNRTPYDEFLYYAWKVGTMGVLPALVAGKAFVDAGKDSLTMLTHATARTIKLRLGYSMICWVVGVSAYIGSFFYWFAFGSQEKTHWLYNFYFLMAVPIIFAAGVVAIMVRPLYLIMLAKLYTDVMTDKVIADEIDPAHPGPGRAGYILRGLFLLLVLFLAAAYFFGDQLGIRHFIEILAMKDFNSQPSP